MPAEHHYSDRVRAPPVARALAAGAMALVLTAAVTGCTADEAEGPASGQATGAPSAAAACGQVSAHLVAAVQRYVGAYGRPVTGAGARQATETTAPDDKALQDAINGTGQALASRGCDREEFRAEFRAGLDDVRTEGPIARAVLLRLSASLTGEAQSTASTVTVRPGDDLSARLAALAPGSQVRLTAGTHRLTDSLVLLQGVTLRGAGRQRTVVVSSAADAGLLVVTDERVELRDLTLQHRGPRAADLVVGGPTASLVLTGVRVQGATSGEDGVGGNGVLMTSRRGATPDRGTTLEVTGSELSHNAAAGILLTGGHVASIRESRLAGNDQCGVCFAGATSGAVRRSAFVDNRVGVVTLDRARPTVVSNDFEGGSVGIQASGRSRPVVQDARISGARRAALIFSEHSRGRVEDSRCDGVRFGIVVAPDALPFLGDNDCTVARGG